MLLVIDNYDSFTFNLVQYFGQLGVNQRVFRNNEITPAEALALNPERVLLSPGPCSPREAGVTLLVVLMGLKTLELRARRDAFVVFFLGFFTMLTNFFYSQSLLTAAAMVVASYVRPTALPLLCTSSMRLSAFSKGYPNSFWMT